MIIDFLALEMQCIYIKIGALLGALIFVSLNILIYNLFEK